MNSTTQNDRNISVSRTTWIAGTCLQGYIWATGEQLEAAFGKAEEYAGDKVNYEWGMNITDADGNTNTATIYDWKYDSKPDFLEKIQWNIGGNRTDVVALIETILCDKTGLKVSYTKAQVR